MREFIKMVLSMLWPFSLFMNKIRELHGINEMFLRQINEKQDEILMQKQELQGLHQILEAAQQKSQALYQDLDAARQELQTAQEEREALQQELRTTQQERETLQEELWTAQQERETLQQELRTTQQEQEALQQELRTTQQERETLQEELRTAQQEREALQQELFELKKSGIYITWPSIEKARQIAANYKEWRTDHFIADMINSPSLFDEMEQLFADEESLKAFHWIILYRFLTPIFGESELWREPELSLLYHIFPGPISEEEFKKSFAKAEEAAASQNLALFAEPYCIWHTFILRQYEHEDLFLYREGDVVFDIGGYVGDTALFFSSLVGESGEVVTFEPHPVNVELIERNIDYFNRKNIRLERFALSDTVGEQTFSELGSSSASFADSGIVVKTMTLDQYVFKNQIKKISVIKMDVEGAEESVLRGGLNTIRRLRPILLVSVYHGGSGYYGDLTRVTLFLKESLYGYQFFLRHKNAQIGETILVCIPEAGWGNRIISSSSFWDEHYQLGGNSGTGSYGRLAQFKSEVVNDFVKREKIRSVLEIGCGDGNQLKMMEYEQYVGVDVSSTIVDSNREIFKEDAGKEFFYALTEREKYTGKVYDMTLSMDVIFHLLEDDVFHQYIDDLFTLADKFVVIYSSNHEEYTPWPEYRHRNFTGYVAEHYPNWKLIQYIPNKYPYQIGKESETSASDFYIFQKQEI